MSRQTPFSVILGLCIAALVIETCQGQGVCNAGYAPDPAQASPPSDPSQCPQCATANCGDCGSTSYLDPCISCTFGYGFTPNGTECIACGSNCFMCTNADTCDECQSTAYGPVFGSYPQACDLCSSNCAYCQSAGAGKCESCNSGYTFDTSSPPQCLPCFPSGCVSCDHSGPGKCDDCISGYGKDNIPGSTGALCKLCECANCETCFDDFQYCNLCMGSIGGSQSSGQCDANAPDYVWRQVWGGLQALSFKVIPWPYGTPVDAIVVHHTQNRCTAILSECTKIAVSMQYNQMYAYKDVHGKRMSYEDLNYSHLICGDGSVLVVRGFNYMTRPRNYAKRGFVYEIGMIGNFQVCKPTAAAMSALDKHIQSSKPYSIKQNAKCYGDYDIRCRACPGKHMIPLIKARPDYGGTPAKCGRWTRGQSRSARK